ncbi:hypothetical protein CEXT_300131, partial [Caerostris extrusa]
GLTQAQNFSCTCSAMFKHVENTTIDALLSDLFSSFFSLTSFLLVCVACPSNFEPVSSSHQYLPTIKNYS